MFMKTARRTLRPNRFPGPPTLIRLNSSYAASQSKRESNKRSIKGNSNAIGGNIPSTWTTQTPRQYGTLASTSEEPETPMGVAHLTNCDPSTTGAFDFAEWDERGKTADIPVNFSTLEDKPSVSRFPNIWLRENCPCPKCRRPDTMQRACDVMREVEHVKGVRDLKEGMEVTWLPSHHISLYPWEWLAKHRPNPALLHPKSSFRRHHIDPSLQLWGAEIKAEPPIVQYDAVMASDDAVGRWTSKIKEYGFCYVDGVPATPEATQELLERIAFIRITHYGGFYDFTSDLTMKDTAYTSEALGPHTDTTYFTDPAGLQAFHMLSHTEGEGGESILVDGFNAAQQMSSSDFECLQRVPIPWHASGNEGITIVPAKPMPVFSCGELDMATGMEPLMQVRWNNDDRGVVPLNMPDDWTVTKWYEAAKKYNDLVNSEAMVYREQLFPGRVLIFDNWRVLHGRAKFTGKRRMCGAYINHDDYISRWRNTNFKRGEIMKQIL